MGFIWYFHGFFGNLMGVLWHPSGIAMASLWDFYDMFMMFLWDYSGIAMGWLWDVHDILLNFHWEVGLGKKQKKLCMYMYIYI